MLLTVFIFSVFKWQMMLGLQVGEVLAELNYLNKLPPIFLHELASKTLQGRAQFAQVTEHNTGHSINELGYCLS